MEENEEKLISAHLNELINYTDCSSSFLAYLIAKDVLGGADISSLKSTNDRMRQAFDFYKIIITRKNSYGHLLDALRETRQMGVLGILGEIKSTDCVVAQEPIFKNILRRAEALENLGDVGIHALGKKQDPIWFDVQPPVRLFTGREQELFDLHEKILQGDGKIMTVVSQMAAISGLGGIGKTELSRQYINKSCNFFDKNVVWIGAESERSMVDSFKRLAEIGLCIPTKDSSGNEFPVAKIVHDSYNFFRGRKSLFVFDNAENEPYTRDFMPLNILPDHRPFVLVTSRDTEWELEVDVLILNELKVEEAMQLVQSGLDTKERIENDESVLALVNKLQCFPLALQQAISYIKGNRRVIENYSIEKYLQNFDRNAEKILKSEINMGSLNTYKQTTFDTRRMTTQLISLDNLHGCLAINILSITSYFEADKIPIESLMWLSDGDDEELIFALKLLRKYSMINIQQNSGMISIHRLVQEVVRIQLRHDYMELESLQKTAEAFLKDLCPEFVTHAIAVWSHIAKHICLVKKFSVFPSAILRVLNEAEKFYEAERYGNNCFEFLLPLLKNDVGLIQINIQLTYLLSEKGALNEGLALGLRTLEEAHKLMGWEHPEAFDLEFYLSQIYYQQSKFQECERNCRRALERVKCPQTVNKITFVRMHNILGSALAEAGNDIEAVTQFKKALEMGKVILGENNRRIDSITQNIAVTHYRLGDVSTAVDILRQTYKNAKRERPEHVTTLLVGYNLSVYLLEQGKIEEALKVCNNVIKQRTKILGPDHFQTSCALIIRAELLSSQGKYEEAILIQQDAYANFAKQIGENHLFALDLKMKICRVFSKIGMRQEALQYLYELLETLVQTQGEKCFCVQETKFLTAEILIETENYGEAKIVLLQLQDKLITLVGENHKILIKVKQKLEWLTLLTTS